MKANKTVRRCLGLFLSFPSDFRGLYENDKSWGFIQSSLVLIFFPEILLCFSFFGQKIAETLCLLSVSEQTQLPSTKAKGHNCKVAPDICSIIVSVFYLIVLWQVHGKSQGHGVQPQDFSVTVWCSPFGLTFLVILQPGFSRSSEQFFHINVF